MRRVATASHVGLVGPGIGDWPKRRCRIWENESFVGDVLKIRNAPIVMLLRGDIRGGFAHGVRNSLSDACRGDGD